MSLLKVSYEKQKDITVIKCAGTLKSLHEDLLIHHLETSFKDGARATLFDWSEISYFDSMGLETLITMHKLLEKYPGCFMAVLICDSVLIEVYVTLGFHKIVPLFTDKNHALEMINRKLESADLTQAHVIS